MRKKERCIEYQLMPILLFLVTARGKGFVAVADHVWCYL